LSETGRCFSPSALRNAASSNVSSGGGVRLRLAALGFPAGGRKVMLALYTKRCASMTPRNPSERGTSSRADVLQPERGACPARHREGISRESSLRRSRSPHSRYGRSRIGKLIPLVRRPAVKLSLLALLLALPFSALLVQAQGSRPIPPGIRQAEKADAQNERSLPPPMSPRRTLDLDKLRRDANELAALAQSIPPDVEQTAKGILPKELSEKLKRIQKLAKQLQSQISQ
jgi:hypothetical protein